jgi:hypothetical protein
MRCTESRAIWEVLEDEGFGDKKNFSIILCRP